MPRVDRDAGEREIKLGDESYVVKFDATRLIQLENLLNLECGDIQERLARASVRTIRAVLFVGTRRYHKRDIRKMEDLDDMLNEVEDTQELLTDLMEAFQSGMPGFQAPEEEEGLDVEDLDDEPEVNGSSSRQKRTPKRTIKDEAEKAAVSANSET